MSEGTRRERMRASTDLDIRRQARKLLVANGRDAVSLRAIAREMGMTAPALYRYYDSREALLSQLCEDVCGELSVDLDEVLESVDADDHAGRVFAVTRGFRGWALRHPQEFALVFATPVEETGSQPGGDQFAGVFLRTVAPLMLEGAFAIRSERVPSDMHQAPATDQRALAAAFSTAGLDVPSERIRTGDVYFMLTWWVRIYGHVALEVFGRFPFAVDDAERVFGSLLGELWHDLGLDRGESE
jgi:AcrR family transcriptional regulator